MDVCTDLLYEASLELDDSRLQCCRDVIREDTAFATGKANTPH